MCCTAQPLDAAHSWVSRVLLMNLWQALPAGTAGEYTLDLAEEPPRDASGKPLSQAARRRKVGSHTLCPSLHDTMAGHNVLQCTGAQCGTLRPDKTAVSGEQQRGSSSILCLTVLRLLLSNRRGPS